MKNGIPRIALAGLAALVWLAGCSASRYSEGQIMAAAPSALPAIVEGLRNEQRSDPDSPELRFLLARALLRAGKAGEAERVALEAVRRLPFDGVVVSLMGDIYLAQNKRFRALTAYNEAITLDPDLLPAYVSLGRVRGLLGQEQAAELALREALQREPAYYPAQYELARLLFKQGKPHLATEVVAAALRIRPAAPEARLLEIRIKKAQGRLTAAAYLAARALRQPPAAWALRRELRRELLDIYVQREQWNKAAAMLDKMAFERRLAAEDILIKADVLRGKGRKREAGKLVAALMRREPNHPRVVLAGAEASIAGGKSAAALPVLEGAVERDPKLAEAYYWMSVAHYQLGQDTKGNAALDIATALAPLHPAIQLLRVRRLLAGRKLSEATPLLNAYLSAHPGDGNARLVRGELQTMLGNYAGAERDLQGVVPTTTESAVRFAKARLAYLRGQYRAVLDETAQLAKRASTPWQLVYLHAAARMRLGQGAAALPLLRARLRLGHGGGELHRLVGDIHHLAGARGKAENIYIAGLNKFPRQSRLLGGLSRLAMEAGKWKQARKWLEIALERPSRLKGRFLERLRIVYLRLKNPVGARSALKRYLAATDPLVREPDSVEEQHILFNTAFPVIGYADRGGADTAPVGQVSEPARRQ